MQPRARVAGEPESFRWRLLQSPARASALAGRLGPRARSADRRAPTVGEALAGAWSGKPTRRFVVPSVSSVARRLLSEQQTMLLHLDRRLHRKLAERSSCAR